MAGMRACGISREGGELLVLPYDNGGTTGEGRGYRGRPDAEALRLPTDAPAEAVGRAVRAALEQATTGPGAPVT
jgi:hypothetical protein